MRRPVENIEVELTELSGGVVTYESLTKNWFLYRPYWMPRDLWITLHAVKFASETAKFKSVQELRRYISKLDSLKSPLFEETRQA